MRRRRTTTSGCWRAGRANARHCAASNECLPATSSESYERSSRRCKAQLRVDSHRSVPLRVYRAHVDADVTETGQMQANLPTTFTLGARSGVGQASKSTAKRGWIKRWHPTHNRDYRAGPDAAGATRNSEGSNAAGATRSTAVLFGDVRAGRAAARSFVSGLK